MKRMRPYSDIYNFVMMIMTFIAAAVLVQKGFWGHLDPWVGVLRCSPCLLAYIAGRFLHGRNPIISLIAGILLSLALSAVSVMLVWKADIYAIIGSVLVAPGTFLMFMAPFAHGSAIMGSARFITGIAIFLVAIIAGGANNEIYRPTLNTMAILYLVAGLYTFNRENLRDAAKFNLPSSGKGKYPPGMRRNNILMLTALIAIGLIVANFDRLRDFVVKAAKFIALQILSLIYFIFSLMAGGEDGGSTGPSMGFPGFMDGKARDPNPIIELIVRIFVIIIIIVGALLILYAIYKLIRKVIRNLPSWLQSLLDKLRHDQSEDFIDETEDLLEKGGFRKELAKNISDLWDRITYRPPKFDDFPDNRSKVRFVFKLLLKRISTNKSHLLSLTPNELAEEANRELREDSGEFMQAYNRARYDANDVPDSDAELARKILRKI
jgi:hypothetical protein